MYHYVMADTKPLCPNCGATSNDYKLMPESVAEYTADMTVKPLPVPDIYIGKCRRCGHTEKYHRGPVLTAEVRNRRVVKVAHLCFLRAGEKDAYGNGI